VRDRPGAADDRAPPVGDPRGGVVRVDLVHAEQPGGLGGVGGQDGASLRERDLVPQARQHAEREGVEQHGGLAVGQGAEDRPDQGRRALRLVQAGADDDRVGALELGREVRGRRAGGRAVRVLGQREHAGLRCRHRERCGDRRGDRQGEPPGADPQRRQAGQRGGAGRAPGAAHDEHAAADVLRAVPWGQRPAAQQRGGEGRGVSHRPAPGAP